MEQFRIIGAAPQIFDLSRGGPAKPDSETLWVSDLYRILRTLQCAMNAEEFDPELISTEALGISEPRRRAQIFDLTVAVGP